MFDKPIENFDDAYMNDPVVKAGVRAGLSKDEIIVALVNRHKAMMKNFTKLRSIAPMRVKLEDGRTFIWHCPDEFIPEEDLFVF